MRLDDDGLDRLLVAVIRLAVHDVRTGRANAYDRRMAAYFLHDIFGEQAPTLVKELKTMSTLPNRTPSALEEEQIADEIAKVKAESARQMQAYADEKDAGARKAILDKLTSIDRVREVYAEQKAAADAEQAAKRAAEQAALKRKTDKDAAEREELVKARFRAAFPSTDKAFEEWWKAQGRAAALSMETFGNFAQAEAGRRYTEF